MRGQRSSEMADLAGCVPHPARDANKYSRGRLVVVGGSAAYPGAACLAACAGQRMGAGYTEVFCAERSVPIVRAARASLVVRSWDGLNADALAAEQEGRPAAVVVGPGVDALDESSWVPVLAAFDALSLIHI